MRYVLYYADYRDELKRVKKGRSYLLFLPSMRIETSISKTPKSVPKLKVKTDEDAEKKEAVARLERMREKDAVLLKEVRAKQEAQGQKIEGKIAIFILFLSLMVFWALIK